MNVSEMTTALKCWFGGVLKGGTLVENCMMLTVNVGIAAPFLWEIMNISSSRQRTSLQKNASRNNKMKENQTTKKPNYKS
jgi:hypothetical protein